jgi:protein-L-isoaspartate O-methyltransferase
MLESLDVRNGHRVLEIGTGSGYNAALLSHRLGAERVFSVDVEPELVELARNRLAKIGYRPTLVACDGVRGLPEHAPYDRVIATCAVPAVPWAWIEHTTVGGVVLADVKLLGQYGSLVRLTRTSRDQAEGRFDATYGSFMRLRHQPGPYEHRPCSHPETTLMAERVTRVDPRTPFQRLVVWFLAGPRIGSEVGLGYAGAILAAPHGRSRCPPRTAPGARSTSPPTTTVDTSCEKAGREPCGPRWRRRTGSGGRGVNRGGNGSV